MDPSQNSLRDEDIAEDMFRILIATDIHLGYAEDDPVLGSDTFDTFNEIFTIADQQKVDFVLLGGDLFHHAQPSPYCIAKCMEILKKYCLGDRPVFVEFLSDPSHNFSQSMNPTVNYEDPNLNVAIPVFSIHGNHDDPTGQKHISSLDLLSTTGLVNYFGRWNNFDQVEISPILLKKGNTKLALYGLSHIRDERLGRLILENKVKLLSPEDAKSWFHLLVLHQNRVARGNKNFIPESSLSKSVDLVIWGHEHDCRIEVEQPLNGVNICQPGSSVATSLVAGESIPKKVGILKIYKNSFKLETVELKSVRPFKYAEIILKDRQTLFDENEDDITSPSEYSTRIVTSKVDSMIREAKALGRHSKVSEKPLIRLIVLYKDESQVINTIRFGQSYVDRVANPENMVKFQAIKNPVRRKKDQSIQEEDQGPILADRVEDLVSQHFTDKESLKLFPLTSLNEAVKKCIDSSDVNAVSDVVDKFMKETLKHLNESLPELEETEDVILAFKNNMDKDAENFVNNILNDPGRVASKSTNSVDKSDDVLIIDDDNSDDDGLFGNKKQTTRGRGATRRATKARGSRRSARGRANN